MQDFHRDYKCSGKPLVEGHNEVVEKIEMAMNQILGLPIDVKEYVFGDLPLEKLKDGYPEKRHCHLDKPVKEAYVRYLGVKCISVKNPLELPMQGKITRFENIINTFSLHVTPEAQIGCTYKQSKLARIEYLLDP